LNNIDKVLVVAAHPDDEVLGCGGTVARFLNEGKEVHVLILGGITTSRYKKNQKEESWKKNEYKGEAHNAATALGLTSLKCVDFDDNRFDTVPLLEIIKAVEKAKNEVKPDLILTHDFADLNVDHRLTHQAVMAAFRPDVSYNFFRIMTFEVLSNTECQDQAMSTFRPNCYIDIKDFLAKKIGAIKCYQSELRSYPHPRSLEGVESLAKKRGMEVCLEYAEAFRIVRDVL